MTNSMTGFSRASSEQETGSLIWELRSVNHRYLDVLIKLPEELRGIESAVRNKLMQQIKRGKIECNLRYKPAASKQLELCVNEANANAVLKACQAISKRLHQSIEMNVLEVLKWPGVIEDQESDLSPVMEEALVLFEQAMNDLCSSRKNEGDRLQVLIEDRCDTMKKIVTNERSRRPQIAEQLRNKLQKKVEELTADFNQDRFEQELVYIAQKMDVDEELDRLESHFQEIQDIFKREEPIGRRLDFIMQEFNREVNTLGSKSTDIETTKASVELKVLIEQMREQVQNIE